MKISPLCLFVVLTTAAHAQSPRAYENAAKTAAESKDYYTAMQYYEKVLQMEPARLEVSYRYADAALEYGAYRQAEAYYEKTVAEDNAGLFPDAAYRLANTKKTLGKYDEAIDLYQKFIKNDKLDRTIRENARQEMEQCEWAMEKLSTPDHSLIVERLPEGINTPESDFAATDMNGVLYFSSFRPLEWGDKNFPARPIAKVMEAKVGETPILTAFNDAKRHTAHAAFSPDGRLMVFNMCDYTSVTGVGCELYFSKRNNDVWSAPEKLPEAINAEGASISQPNVHQRTDGYYDLYYVSNAPGGSGGQDIWYTKFSATGTFDQPINLAFLNTPDDEATPFFDNTSKALYFSTKGRWTLGGYDIYKIGRKNDQWQDAEHLPFPVNSSFDDLYFAPQTDGEWAYFSSNRSGSEFLDESVCCYDIYKMKWLPIQLEASAFSAMSDQALDQVTFKIQEVQDEATAKGEEQFSGDKNSSDFKLLRTRRYMVTADKKHYSSDTTYVTTYTYPSKGELKSKLFLTPKIDLTVHTFHQWTKAPLNEVRVRLYEMPTVVSDEKNTGTTSNQTQHEVGGKRQFAIIAEKDGFIADTSMVTEEEMLATMAGEKINRNLFLAPASMSAYLPISLFFDNDQPRPAGAIASYEQTVDKYMARREQFIQTYTAGLQGAEKEQAAGQLAKFFDQDVKGGQTKLETFTANLDLFLKNGQNIDIMVKAFASPLAKPEYNLALTERRIASVRSYLRKYGNGIFEQYLRNGQLKVSMLPLGEREAPTGVSDDARDKRSSVFSVEASRERRAEILEVRLFKN